MKQGVRLRGLAAGAVVVALTTCGPAAAATLDLPAVAPGVAGPAFAGEAVVWGEERANGSATVRRWVPGGPVETLHRIAAPPRRERRDRRVGFTGVPGAVAASSSRVAWVAIDSRVTSRGSDFINSQTMYTPVGLGTGDAVATPLLPGCLIGNNASVAVDGATVAVGVYGQARCGGEIVPGGVWLVDGDAPPRPVWRADGYATDLQLAGPWVAWLDLDRILIADRATGRVVDRLGPRAFGGRGSIDGFGLDPDGTIVAATGPQRSCRYACLRVMRLDDRRPRLLDRRAGTDVALAGGRVAYVRALPRFRGRVVVADLEGAITHRFERLGRHETVFGDIALEPGRIAWSSGTWEAVPGASPALHVRALR